MTESRQYLWLNGKKIYDGWEVRTEILCDHCKAEIEPDTASTCLLSVRISSINLTTEMGMEKPLQVHPGCIYDCIREHVMERVKNQAGKWYVQEDLYFPVTLDHTRLVTQAM